MSNFIVVKLIEQDIHVGCVYRYGESNINEISDVLENNLLKYKRLIVLGDMNINIKCLDHQDNAIQMNGFLFLNSLDINHFTRKKNSIGTYIDHVITNTLKYKYNLSLHDTPISDHRVIFLSVILDRDRISKYEAIDNDINKLEQILNENEFELFHEGLIEMIRENTKEKVIKIKKKKQWMNHELPISNEDERQIFQEIEKR